MKGPRRRSSIIQKLLAAGGLVIVGGAVWSTSIADDTICASVKIRIDQDLTLNRQGFDAEMIIHNELPRTDLTEVSITVTFYDENMQAVPSSSDPNASNALFFVQSPVLSGIEQIPNGTVGAASDAEIHWLIVPTLDAAANASNYTDSAGSLFYVGATLAYKIDGVEYQTEVDKDYIYVKPMPDLALDYFLPQYVYGDDPLTTGVQEPIIPFSLGLRAINNGYGWARDLAIEAVQPRIIDNSQGLLVAYNIEDVEVNGTSFPNTLLVEFGDMEPESGVSVARWVMTCSLSGSFTNFNAYLSHADELGGALTSLIAESNVVTHVLRHDVLVDCGDRDDIRDFLATDDIVYESDGHNTAVSNISAIASLVLTNAQQYHLSFSQPVSGFIYARLANPESSEMVVAGVMRSDGKAFSPHNIWLSSVRNGSVTNHYLDFFDCNASNSSYLITYDAATNANRSPRLAYIADQVSQIDTSMTFTVNATDPDATIPELSADPLPAGAQFVDRHDGTGTFTWTPTAGQVGAYRVKFSATDGELSDSQRMSLTVDSDDPHGSIFLFSWTPPGIDSLSNTLSAVEPGAYGRSSPSGLPEDRI